MENDFFSKITDVLHTVQRDAAQGRAGTEAVSQALTAAIQAQTQAIQAQTAAIQALTMAIRAQRDVTHAL